MYTLNQDIDLFKNFAENHGIIKGHFVEGDIWEFVNKTPEGKARLTYPVMFCEILQPSLNGKEYTRNYNFYFFDLVKKGEANELEVLSDMEQVFLDFFSYLAKNEIGDRMLTRQSNPQDFTEKFDDWASGWLVPVSLRLAFQYNSCDIPFNE